MSKNRPAHPVTIVVADEVHERTMYTQMIIGLARTEMKENPTMILILMSATVDVAELKLAIPGAQDIEIDQHECKVSRFFLQRDITKLTNVLERLVSEGTGPRSSKEGRRRSFSTSRPKTKKRNAIFPVLCP